MDGDDGLLIVTRTDKTIRMECVLVLIFKLKVTTLA